MLKAGGRMAVCLSVTRTPALEPGVKWPLCMQTFLPLEQLRPVCEQAGFVSVHVDESDSLMQFELPAAEDVAPEGEPAPPNEERSQRARSQVHVGSPEFEHLKEFDMNALCARVVVTGIKPQLPIS